MSPGVQQVTVEQIGDLVGEGALLLDVREPDEWTLGHAPQAVHVPLSELSARLAELPTDRPILAVCHGGGRSSRVTQALSQQGYDVRNVDGGMAAWERAGLPVVDDAGNPGRID